MSSLALWLLVCLAECAVLALAQRQLAPALIRSLRFRLFWAPLVAPGTVLHELGHGFMAVLLRVRVRRFVPFWPHTEADGSIRFGYVEIDRVDPLRNALVAIAPLLLVPLLLALFDQVAFGTVAPDNVVERLLDAPVPWRIAWLIVVGLGSRGAFPSVGDRLGAPGVVALGLLGGLAATVMAVMLPPDSIATGLHNVAVLLAVPAGLNAAAMLVVRLLA